MHCFVWHQTASTVIGLSMLHKYNRRANWLLNLIIILDCTILHMKMLFSSLELCQTFPTSSHTNLSSRIIRRFKNTLSLPSREETNLEAKSHWIHHKREQLYENNVNMYIKHKYQWIVKILETGPYIFFSINATTFPGLMVLLFLLIPIQLTTDSRGK